MQSARLTDEEKITAGRQLVSCESSDWFWLFGDYNPAQTGATFDQLFWQNLINLYQLLKLPVPSVLYEPIAMSKRDGHVEASGTMRRSS